MKNEICSEHYHSYLIQIFKSGDRYLGVVSYHGKTCYESKSDKGWTDHLLIHLKWWIRDRGNKSRTRPRVRIQEAV